MLSAFLLALPLGCGGKDNAPPPAPKVPVKTAEVETKDVPETLRAVGEVEPVASALVTPQVNGILKEVHFSEGQEVNAGDLLVLIDPAPYEAELAQAEAQLQRDRAQLESARAQLQRMDSLVKKDFVSREQYDEARANAGALAGAVKADEAAIKNAQIRLGYCSVRSPISGRAGALLVKAGNVVTANNPENALVRINQLKPVYVRFSVPETAVDSVRKRQSASGPLEVSAFRSGTSAGHRSDAAVGRLTFVDNAVDRATGTLLLKATFDNGDEALWPGEFLDVSLRIGIREQAIAIPSAAVQTGQQGEYVYVIKPDATAELRLVKIAFYNQKEAVVADGLASGENVVIDGHIRLYPGAKTDQKDSK